MLNQRGPESVDVSALRALHPEDASCHRNRGRQTGDPELFTVGLDGWRNFRRRSRNFGNIDLRDVRTCR
jgi:hypothetical protein